MAVLEWMLDADPSIRWQALRDLAAAPSEVVGAAVVRDLEAGPAHHAGDDLAGVTQPHPRLLPGDLDHPRETVRCTTAGPEGTGSSPAASPGAWQPRSLR